MAFRKKAEDAARGPQEVIMTWGNRDFERSMLVSSLFQAAAHLTQAWYIVTGTKPETPEEMAETFQRVYRPLDEWYNVEPLKAEVKGMLDTLYPDPAGYEPGETLLQKEHTLMPDF